ncbi:MAG: antitoxin MazE family protein [Microthrixaceae bacterium]
MARRSSTPTSERVRAYRERLRAQGLRPVQIWVPDVRSPQFVEQAHLQSAAVAASTHESDDQAFIDALSSDDG